MSEDKDRPYRTAVALRYDGESAPRVVAKGKGYVADEILALAARHGVPLHDDAHLVQLLARLELNQEIPSELYVAVARVIAFAYWVSGKIPPQAGDR